MRDTRFSIVKALAIILVVLSHAGISGWLFNAVFLFHVPAFFICAGYFFHTRYLSDERTFVVHRLKGLYLPFLRWSLFFLVVHNLLFSLGLLSETYGNSQGGVTHPYNWAQFSQNLWSIVCNMSGYDPFLGGTFWFFRALLLSSIGFLLLFKLLRRSAHFRTDKRVGWGILAIAFLLALWQVWGSLRMTGVAQGGYRELMGLFFMAVGFLLRQYEVTRHLTWRLALPAALVLGLAAWLCPSSMVWRANWAQFLSLPLPALAGFYLLLYASQWIDAGPGKLRAVGTFIGERTLYIFAFHLLAFKLVSALKVACDGLPWQAIGSHPVIHDPANNVWWIMLYTFVGVGIPLLWITGYRHIASRVNLAEGQMMSMAIVCLRRVCLFVVFVLRQLGKLLKNMYRNMLQMIKDVIAAANPKDE